MPLEAGGHPPVLHRNHLTWVFGAGSPIGLGLVDAARLVVPGPQSSIVATLLALGS